MTTPTYDVIIAAYNAEKYLAETIQSVLNSTVLPEVIWVIDDASTDRTAEIASQFDRVELIQNQINKERSYSRNIGIQRSTANFIQILDADDLIHHEKVEQQLDFWRNHPQADFLYGDVQIFHGDYRPENITEHRSYFEKDLLDLLIRKNTMAIHSFLFKREFFEKYGVFDEKLPISEDRELYIRAILNGARYVYTPSATAYYRMHDEGTIVSRRYESAYYNALPIRMHREQLAGFKQGKYRSVTGESLRTLARNANIYGRPFDEVIEIIREADELRPYPSMDTRKFYRAIEALFGPVFLERLLRIKFWIR